MKIILVPNLNAHRVTTKLQDVLSQFVHDLGLYKKSF